MSWTATTDAEGLRIDASTAALPAAGRHDLDGLTFYVEAAGRARLVVDGREELPLCINPPDQTGRASVSVAWPRLSFPQV
jgi:hypothetical protein